MRERANSPSGSRKAWAWVAVALLLVLILLGAGAGGYLRYANELPLYMPPTVRLPNPNAYADFAAAGGLLPRREVRAARGGKLSLQELKKAVAGNDRALRRLRQGLDRECVAPPIVSFKQLLPELTDFRRLGGALLLEGELAEREGRLANAARSYRDCLRLGSRIPRGGSVIHGLIGITVQEMGLRALNRVADRLDAPAAAALAREMEALHREAVPLSDVLKAEKASALAGIHELLREKGPMRASAELSGQVGSSGNPIAPDLPRQIAFALTPKRQMIDGYARYMDAMIRRSGQPFAQRGGPPPLPADPLGSALAPLIEPVQARWDWRDAQWRLAVLRLAAVAYQREHGRWPERAEQLVPRYLQAVPADPFASQPLVYRFQNGKPLVYSRGPDGDDDRGDHQGSQATAQGPGDIVWVGPLRAESR